MFLRKFTGHVVTSSNGVLPVLEKTGGEREYTSSKEWNRKQRIVRNIVSGILFPLSLLIAYWMIKIILMYM